MTKTKNVTLSQPLPITRISERVFETKLPTAVTVHAHQEGATSDPFDKIAADCGWNPPIVGEAMTVTFGTKRYKVTRISCDAETTDAPSRSSQVMSENNLGKELSVRVQLGVGFDTADQTVIGEHAWQTDSTCALGDLKEMEHSGRRIAELESKNESLARHIEHLRGTRDDRFRPPANSDDVERVTDQPTFDRVDGKMSEAERDAENTKGPEGP